MRKLIASALMTAFCIVLLTSCSAGKHFSETVREIQNDYNSADKISGAMSLSANYGEKVYDYRISFDLSENGGTLEILEPEEISGVIATVSDGGATLSFDGAEVYSGEILPDGLSPLSAIPVITNAWRTGLVIESVKESIDGTGCASITFRISDDVSLRTWFEIETHLPLYAELVYNGYSVITCSFDNVRVE